MIKSDGYVPSGNVNLAKNVKRAMLEKDIKSGQLAEMMGMSKQYLSNTISVKGIQTASMLDRFCEALDCDVVLRDRKTGKLY